MTSLYSHLLSRQPTSTEEQTWVGQINSINYSGIAEDVLGSGEYRQDAVAMDYTTLLHRGQPAAQSEIAYWASSSMDLLSIESAMLSSTEFYTNG